MNGNIRDRRNWTRGLTVLLVVVLLATAIGYLLKEDAAGTERFYLSSTAGAVLFDHGWHKEAADSCVTCHHDLLTAAQATECAECHDAGMVAEEYDHATLKEVHNRDCSQCHQQEAGDDQALSCRQCHPALQPSETVTTTCSECHEDGYSPDMLGHDEYTEVEEHTCQGCHSPRSVAEAYHVTCSDCHLQTAPELFAQADGEVQCAACHLR